MLISLLYSVKLLLQLRDILFLGHFHLFEDFFLGIKLSIQILCLSNRLIDLVLEFEVLLLKDLDLTIG